MEKYFFLKKTWNCLASISKKELKIQPLGGRIKNIDIEMKKIWLIVKLKLRKKHKGETEIEFLDISLTKT